MRPIFWPVKFARAKFLQFIPNIYTKCQQKMVVGFLKRFDCHSQHALVVMMVTTVLSVAVEIRIFFFFFMVVVFVVFVRVEVVLK